MRFLDYFSMAKTKEFDQVDWCVSDAFRAELLPFSVTYHLQVSAPVSLKPAIKASFEGKKTLRI